MVLPPLSRELARRPGAGRAGWPGTDFPMGSNNGEDWPVEVLDTIRSLGLSPADEELLLRANLHRIMRL